MSHLLAQLPLARFEVDRAATMRANPNWLNEVWQKDSTRVLVIQQEKIPVTDDLSLILVKPEFFNQDAKSVAKNVCLLGITDSNVFLAYFAEEDNLAEASWVSLRSVGAQLSALEVGLATTATALDAWHKSHQFCPKCGSETKSTSAGWSRTCLNDNSEHYPRTEPAMIVAVHDENDRILLGRRKEWPETWFSTLAGFVEAGESAEACVLREVYEESGIDLDPQSLTYLGSQPWPFPASLMLGYRAKALTTGLVSDEEEMAEVRWFSKDEFATACELKTLQLPNKTTIAWHLIADWYGQPMPTTWCR